MLLFATPLPLVYALLVHPLSCLFILRRLIHLTRLKRPVRLYPRAIKHERLRQDNVVMTQFLDVRSVGRIPLRGEVLGCRLIILLWTFEQTNLQDHRQYVHLEQRHDRVLGQLHEVLDRVHRIHLQFQILLRSKNPMELLSDAIDPDPWNKGLITCYVFCIQR